MRSRQEVQTRRMATLAGIVGGVFLFAFFRTGFGRLNEGEPFRSFFFRHAENWPKFIQSFAPLDLVLTCVYLWAVMFLVLNYTGSKNASGGKDLAKFMLGYFVGFGSVGGVFGAVMAGWYSSFEFFLLMAVMMTGIVAGLFACVAAVLAIGWLMQRLWQRVRTTPVVKPLVKFGKFMNADDVPEAPESGSFTVVDRS